jgi:hypothetical protein
MNEYFKDPLGLKKLNKNETLETFELVNLIDTTKIKDAKYLLEKREELFERLGILLR